MVCTEQRVYNCNFHLCDPVAHLNFCSSMFLRFNEQIETTLYTLHYVCNADGANSRTNFDTVSHSATTCAAMSIKMYNHIERRPHNASGSILCTKRMRFADSAHTHSKTLLSHTVHFFTSYSLCVYYQPNHIRVGIE